MPVAPTLNAAARSPLGTTLDRPITQSSSAKKVVRRRKFSGKFGIWRILSNDATENASFLSNLVSLPGNCPK
jgi:hypothetical protein